MAGPVSEARPGERPGRPALPTASLPAANGTLERWLRGDRGVLVFLVVLTVASAVLMQINPRVFPPALFALPLLLTDVLLPPRRVPAFVAFLVLVMCVETLVEVVGGQGLEPRRLVVIFVVLVMSAVVLRVAVRRARLGVAGLRGESMLFDLQAQIRRNGQVPALPPSWAVDVATRSAEDTSFAGDFMVAHRSDGRDRLSLVVVDVSGKGVEAGTRSLLLSGAFGGLLGAVEPAEFLPSANEFVLRQAWDEGFATAVHLSLDLTTGAYEVRNAGHPPAIHFLAGSGRWHVDEQTTGPMLGLVPRPSFPVMRGRMGSGDALLLYTDGLVERRRRDIGLGIDRLLGEAERLVRTGFAQGARTLVEQVGSRDDDCALVLVQRR